ncbi:MAG: FliM/FliN family flagellar motor switch protein [Planctomycetota bacterium]
MSAAEPERYDFAKPRRFSRDELLTVEELLRRSEKKLNAAINDALRLTLATGIESVDQVRFEAVLDAAQERQVVYAVRIKPINATGLLLLDATLVLATIDRLTGGRGLGQQPARELTPVDDIVSRPFLQLAVQTMAAGWATTAQPLQFELDRRLIGHALESFADPKDVALCVVFALKAENFEQRMRLVVPHAALKPHLALLMPRRTAEKKSAPAQHELSPALNDMKVALSARIGKTRVRMRDLLKLCPGDVLVLDQKLSAPVRLLVSGKDKFLGKLGVRDGRKAVLVENVLGRNPAKAKP